MPEPPVGEAVDSLIVGSTVGTLTHRLIAKVIEMCGPTPSPIQILEVADALSVRAAPINRQALITSSTTLTAAYFRRFPIKSATYLGAEQWAGQVPIDLMWRLPNGNVWFDEIKTGLSIGGFSHAKTLAQVREQWEVGRDTFGDSFGGVRGLMLRSPARSFLFRGVSPVFGQVSPS